MAKKENLVRPAASAVRSKALVALLFLLLGGVTAWFTPLPSVNSTVVLLASLAVTLLVAVLVMMVKPSKRDS